MMHKLKVLPQFFNLTLAGQKPYEYRKNDRANGGFHRADTLWLREWENGKYTGRWIKTQITGVLGHEDFDPIKEGYVILSISYPRFSERHTGTKGGNE